MKYLVLLLIVLGLVWWIRQPRRTQESSRKTPSPTVMVPCAYCGTHVAQDDAIPGAQGLYCSAAHRDVHAD